MNLEKEFCGQQLVSNDENEDMNDFKKDTEAKDQLMVGCKLEKLSLSTCSGYCSMLEDEEMAYENELIRSESSTNDINERKMTCILKYNECRKFNEIKNIIRDDNVKSIIFE